MTSCEYVFAKDRSSIFGELLSSHICWYRNLGIYFLRCHTNQNFLYVSRVDFVSVLCCANTSMVAAPAAPHVTGIDSSALPLSSFILSFRSRDSVVSSARTKFLYQFYQVIQRKGFFEYLLDTDIYDFME